MQLDKKCPRNIYRNIPKNIPRNRVQVLTSPLKVWVKGHLTMYYVRTQGWVDDSENDNFPLRYGLKMSFLIGTVQKSPKTPFKYS